MAAGMLAVLPQGAGPAKSWNLSDTTGNDDVALLSALVTQPVSYTHLRAHETGRNLDRRHLHRSIRRQRQMGIRDRPQGAAPAKSWNLSDTTGNDDVALLSALVT